ncbi:MAG: hypothetical protein AB7L91_17505 [Dehalococcoidia bacterium]
MGNVSFNDDITDRRDEYVHERGGPVPLQRESSQPFLPPATELMRRELRALRDENTDLRRLVSELEKEKRDSQARCLTLQGKYDVLVTRVERQAKLINERRRRRAW